MDSGLQKGAGAKIAVSALTDLAIRPNDPKRQFRFTLGLYTISDLSKLLSTIVDALITVKGMERGYVILREQRLICFRSARTKEPDYFEPEQFFFSQSIVDQIFDRPELHYSLYPETSSSLSLKTVLGIPLILQGDLGNGEESQVLGVVYAESDRIVAYSEEQLELFSILGGHAAMAVENTRLYQMAMIDHLTELYRRHFILSQLKVEWQRSMRHYYPLSIGMIDIDHFKLINDQHGHCRGDVVLRSIAKSLKQGIRREDSLGRYGGEEFLLILPQTCTE